MKGVLLQVFRREASLTVYQGLGVPAASLIGEAFFSATADFVTS